MLLGASLFYLYGFNTAAPSLPASTRRQWPQRVLVIAAATAIVGTVLWIMAETVLFSGDPKDGTRFDAVWLVFSETQFGRVCLVRIALLLISIAASFLITRVKSLAIVEALLATLVIATFAWTGHGAMHSGWPGMIHTSSDVLHLWVAGAWFGALVPLCILILRALHSQAHEDASSACYGLQRFSAIGTAVVAALVLSGLVNSWFLIGISNWRALFTTPYGISLLIKLGLFAVMLVLAAVNRFTLTPRLHSELEQSIEGRSPSESLKALKISVLIETGIAALVLLAVGVLGTLIPPVSGE